MGVKRNRYVYQKALERDQELTPEKFYFLPGAGLPFYMHAAFG